jgi:hypothetical protein
MFRRRKMTKRPREYFEDKCGSWITELKAELDELQFRTENAPWEAGTDESREIKALCLRLEEAEKKLHQLRTTSDNSWSLVRTEIQELLSGLSNAINQKLTAGTGRKD